MKFKVGDIVVGNSKADVRYGITCTGWKGKVFEITKNRIGVESAEYTGDAFFCVDPSCFDLVKSSYPTIIITTDGTTTTAMMRRGKEIIKSESVKLYHKDTFDHATGAKLALDRLFGIEPVKQEVREAKREAKVGEWIRVLCTPISKFNHGLIKKDDMVQITHYGCMPSVKVDDDLIGFRENEYVVLENYTPDNA